MEQETLIVFALSTWTDGKPPESAVVFFEWLEDMVNDFRYRQQRMLQNALVESINGAQFVR